MQPPTPLAEVARELNALDRTIGARGEALIALRVAERHHATAQAREALRTIAAAEDVLRSALKR